MPKMSDKQRELRLEVLRLAIQKNRFFASESVLLFDLWQAYQALADDETHCGSLGGFAKFLRCAGYATFKSDGKTWVLMQTAERTPELLEMAQQEAKRDSSQAAPAPASTSVQPPLQGDGPCQPTPTSTLAPLRVDAPVMLHNVAEAYEAMFDFAGLSTFDVAERMRSGLDRLAESGPSKEVHLELLAGAMALNGAT